jgi:glycerol-3-phosphate dehydrogenase (NAD(P)+)
MVKQATIIGSGAWGSALAALLQVPQQNHWSRRSTQTLGEAVRHSELILSAVSMAGVQSTINSLGGQLTPGQVIVTTTKGLDYTSHLTPSQMWAAAFPQHPIVVLCGPNLSAEIRQGLPAATVAASEDQAAASLVQTLFTSPQFRVYTNDDPLGVELGGTVKNVIAIGAGACDGLGLGNNAKAGLVTRGLAEIIRIGAHWGARPETFYGLSGLGDLLATCGSSLSRNYRVGYGLAQGHSLAEVLATLGGTAEGVNTTQVLMQVAAQHSIELPITAMVDRLLQGETTAAAALTALMQRDRKSEY